jgi:hypothetical protein
MPEFDGVKIYHCRTKKLLSQGFRFWVKAPIPGHCKDFDEIKAWYHGRAFKTLRAAGEYIKFNQEYERSLAVKPD